MTDAWMRVRWRIDGPEQLVVPSFAGKGRQDDLWKTTCFEIFWQGHDEEEYCEFNLSPSRDWAAYRFDGYRSGQQELPVESISMSSGHDGGSLMLVADIWADLPVPARIGLSAVIEEEGALRYYALAHPQGEPDFHSAAARTLTIETATV